ncbi:MAG TPA: carboxypeptidase regulatory-like domain-containing protein [Candidatus Acidoferrum sp.]|nr:carboxypeptidase regulatory-like domain-containing protein [Candidatus Acidoferrum sp.]
MFCNKRNYTSDFSLPILGRSGRLALCLTLSLVLFLATDSWAGVGGSISGTVTDSSGAVVAKANVTATNTDTGFHQTIATDEKGFYSFPNLPIGHYELEVTSTAFRPYRRTGIVIDPNSAMTVDAILAVGGTSDAVTVVENRLHVETTSTQNGEVITGEQITTVPLNGRSFTDLLTLQTGVAPATSITSETVQDVGASVLSPSGDLNPGTISINGQREFANSFIVNGSDVQEDVNMGAAIVPNLDSIAEFRILTNNFDAEYGEFSGGQINVVTKSGSNAFHGDAFEFLRNTNLDARNYFSPTRGTFDQNQFGGTFGGPIRKDKIFFFGDYQGTRSTQGVDTGQIPVPSLQDRTGNLSDLASSFVTIDANGKTVPTTVSGSYFANLLSQKLGYAVSAGEPYYTAGCTSATCVFPGAVIPQSAWSAPATNLLKYIPSPNNANGTFATSASNLTLRDDKGAYRMDANTRWGLLSAYYFLDDWSQNNPYPMAQGGANVPGFNALYLGRAQLLDLGDTKTINATTVNEFHFSYLRNANDLGKPVGGVGVSLASQGFEVGQGTPGIVPLSPKTEGVESVGFNSFTIGTNTNELNQTGNTFQWLDNFSKVIGTHTIKAGGEFHYDQINVNAIAQFNGSFLFFGTETGSDFADFLLGIPSQYNQSQLQAFYGRNKYLGLYAQDSWRATRSLTLNYGLRWDRIEPWYEKYNQIATFVPGQQSVVFPGAPAGILYPTDPGVPRTLAPPGNRDFAPRIGLAYSPSATGNGMLARILGGPGKTSIRASYGMFYTAIEALTIGVMSANAPYGTTYTSPAPPLFATPFVTAASGQNLGQVFPVTLAPLNSSASHPDSNIDWSQFEPITGLPNYPTTNRIPYTEEYMLSLERGFGANTVLSLNYVGTQGHRLLVLEEANPGNPALCLQLSDPANLAPGQVPCGPFGEDTTYTTSTGTVYNGTRGPLGSNFGSNANQSTIGNSNYNALQITLRHTSKRLNVLAGYTFSKSQDQSSNLGEEVNPLDPSLSKALSAFDVKHNFVVSYSYQIPVEKLFRATNRWTEGWELSGITRFSSGLPVTLVNFGDNSLLGSEPNGINNFGVDEPDYSGGPLDLNHNPRNGLSYFNTSQFSENALGSPGTARRRFFYGPGMDNYDMALLKNVRLNEAKSLQFRIEAFNVFNHAQFFGPQAVDGNIDSSTFGQVVSAAPPRLIQLGAKFFF